MKEIDLEVLIDRHSTIWHPDPTIKARARDELRYHLRGIDFIDFWKVIDHVKMPCLLHLRDNYEVMMRNLVEGVRPQELDSVLEVGAQMNDHMRWICAELGEAPNVLFSAKQATAIAKSRVVSGTLLAYGC